MTPPHRSSSGQPLLSGAIGGNATSVGFAGLHRVLAGCIAPAGRCSCFDATGGTWKCVTCVSTEAGPGGGHLATFIEPERYGAAVLAYLAEVERSHNEQLHPIRKP
jgi:hypothetical protein